MTRLIIGGGMAGLVCAIASARKNIHTILIESNSRVGKKISATGNGKCNIANLHTDINCFNQSQIASDVLDFVRPSKYLEFLKSVGIFTYSDPFGRVYPITENANSVVDCLRFECLRLNVEMYLNCTATKVWQTYDKRFDVATSDGQLFPVDQVVLACGSNSQANRATVDGIVPMEYFTPLSPSLVAVKIADMDKLLNGQRLKTCVKLFDSQTNLLIDQERGEVQFRDFGLSGICVMNLSAHIARDIVNGKAGKYHFELDLVPSLTEIQLKNEIDGRLEKGTELKCLLLGILSNKLADSLLRICKKDPSQIAHKAKHFCFKFQALQDFSASQVTAGGICQTFVDKNLQLPNGIFAVGEILNVDGICGGHNLYFAGASAIYFVEKNS